MSWLFIVRDGYLNAYNHMRSNDLLIGMPNDLIDLRLCQLIIAACTGYRVGYLHHQASLFQVYKKDIADVNQLERLLKIRERYFEEDEAKVIEKFSSNCLFIDIADILQEYINKPVSNGSESLRRYQVLMEKLKQTFWIHNPECSAENKQSVLGQMIDND
jgi:thymidylate synthase